MKTIEQTIQQADPVIREVWRTKREIMTEHGGSGASPAKVGQGISPI